jgi:hypothetical protein
VAGPQPTSMRCTAMIFSALGIDPMLTVRP